MLYQAKNGTLQLDNSTMEYIRFGRGAGTLVILPGLGDAGDRIFGTL